MLAHTITPDRLVITDHRAQEDAREVVDQLQDSRHARHLMLVPPPPVGDEPVTRRTPGREAVTADPELPVEISESLVGLFAAVLDVVASGGTLKISSLPKELSTTVAADELGVSRPTLMKMIKRGDIAAHKVGSHTRINAVDVANFKEVRLAEQRQATEALRDLDFDI